MENPFTELRKDIEARTLEADRKATNAHEVRYWNPDHDTIYDEGYADGEFMALVSFLTRVQDLEMTYGQAQ